MGYLALPSYNTLAPGHGRLFSPDDGWATAQSLDLDGINEYLKKNLAASSDLRVGTTFSCGIWFKTLANCAGEENFLMHGFDNASPAPIIGDDVFVLGQSKNNKGFFACGVGGFINNDTETTTAINDGEWHLLGGTYDGTTRRVWLDASNEASDTVSVSIENIDKFCVGAEFRLSAGKHWNGLLDEPFLYDGVALNQAQWTAIYNGGAPVDLNRVGPTERLVGWWDLETIANPIPNEAQLSNGEGLTPFNISVLDISPDVPS